MWIAWIDGCIIRSQIQWQVFERSHKEVFRADSFASHLDQCCCPIIRYQAYATHHLLLLRGHLAIYLFVVFIFVMRNKFMYGWNRWRIWGTRTCYCPTYASPPLLHPLIFRPIVSQTPMVPATLGISISSTVVSLPTTRLIVPHLNYI